MGRPITTEETPHSISKSESNPNNKRMASPGVEGIILQKRRRESSTSDKNHGGSDVEMPTTVTAHATSQTMQASADNVTVPFVPTQPPISIAMKDSLDTYDDDSDFELPPLTMEPDTDPEDDENDQDE